ncbi:MULTISPECIES: DUF7768 domain-containing protein [Clostridium]|uniref:DUF4406 domain-containing protein n=1 Tax=Clostridium lapidicellarium TaxID=3240931 RepID=A0ABV4DV00_9CLOT
MKLVYICSPLRGDVEKNKERANNYCHFAVKEGVLPLAPHTIFTQLLDDDIEEERKKGMNLGLELLKHCDELWVFGNMISDGMKGEIKIAEKLEMPVIRFSSDCKRI